MKEKIELILRRGNAKHRAKDRHLFLLWGWLGTQQVQRQVDTGMMMWPWQKGRKEKLSI